LDPGPGWARPIPMVALNASQMALIYSLVLLALVQKTRARPTGPASLGTATCGTAGSKQPLAPDRGPSRVSRAGALLDVWSGSDRPAADGGAIGPGTTGMAIAPPHVPARRSRPRRRSSSTRSRSSRPSAWPMARQSNAIHSRSAGRMRPSQRETGARDCPTRLDPVLATNSLMSTSVSTATRMMEVAPRSPPAQARTDAKPIGVGGARDRPHSRRCRSLPRGPSPRQL
jgi:hypothetical protein